MSLSVLTRYQLGVSKAGIFCSCGREWQFDAFHDVESPLIMRIYPAFDFISGGFLPCKTCCLFRGKFKFFRDPFSEKQCLTRKSFSTSFGRARLNIQAGRENNGTFQRKKDFSGSCVVAYNRRNSEDQIQEPSSVCAVSGEVEQSLPCSERSISSIESSASLPSENSESKTTGSLANVTHGENESSLICETEEEDDMQACESEEEDDMQACLKEIACSLEMIVTTLQNIAEEGIEESPTGIFEGEESSQSEGDQGQKNLNLKNIKEWLSILTKRWKSFDECVDTESEINEVAESTSVEDVVDSESEFEIAESTAVEESADAELEFKDIESTDGVENQDAESEFNKVTESTAMDNDLLGNDLSDSSFDLSDIIDAYFSTQLSSSESDDPSSVNLSDLGFSTDDEESEGRGKKYISKDSSNRITHEEDSKDGKNSAEVVVIPETPKVTENVDVKEDGISKEQLGVAEDYVHKPFRKEVAEIKEPGSTFMFSSNENWVVSPELTARKGEAVFWNPWMTGYFGNNFGADFSATRSVEMTSPHVVPAWCNNVFTEANETWDTPICNLWFQDLMISTRSNSRILAKKQMSVF